MGNRDTLTLGAWKALQQSECLLGAKRVLASLSDLEAEKVEAVKPNKILEALSARPNFTVAAAVFSGDTGIYSGAKNLIPLLESAGYETQVFPGISSLSYFCAKCKITYQDITVVSAHGRDCNLIAQVMEHQRVFVLAGGENTPAKLCEELCEAGLAGLTVWVGERLSYPDERISTMKAAECAQEEFDPLSVLLIENPQSSQTAYGVHGLPDDLFIRSEEPPRIPMTKSEIRSISLSKLGLKEGSIVYDIGAGTGSVAVEAALQAKKGKVYAIEQNPKAIRLIERNREKFGVKNLLIIPGTAPQALEELPPPDCVFLGGTNGKLEGILTALLEKNPSVQIVLHAIALETASQAVQCLRPPLFTEPEIVQVVVSKAKKVGECHMMLGQNPIYIMSARGAMK